MTKNASFQRNRRFSIPVVATTPRFCDKTREWVQKLSQIRSGYLRNQYDEAVKCCSCCSVAVLKMVYPDPKNTAIFIYIIIYINIVINFDFRITYFGTAALQRCNSECRVMLASARLCRFACKELCRAPAVSTKSTLQQHAAKGKTYYGHTRRLSYGNP